MLAFAVHARLLRRPLLLGLGVFFGAWIGARLAHVIPAVTLQRMFAVFMVVAAVRLWLKAGESEMTAPRDESATSRLVLSSLAFAEGTPVPARHTCEGEDLSPPLAWTGVPVDTRSFALICDDPDAPRGTWVHWLLWNLPADAIELGEGVPAKPELPSGARQGINDGGDIGYAGPCPPPGGPHRYYFRLHALDSTLNLPPGANRSDLEAAMQNHVLARAVTMGTYERKKR